VLCSLPPLFLSSFVHGQKWNHSPCVHGKWLTMIQLTVELIYNSFITYFNEHLFVYLCNECILYRSIACFCLTRLS